jgi:polyisoprenyl-phosphate glycosyltransferase
MSYLEQIKKFQKKYKVSCIIPAWNEEENISKVIKVVKTYPVFDEIIVVDDGSKDNTVKIVKQFNVKHLKLISHKFNQGKTAAVKTGVDNSRGDLIVLLDADLIGLSHENISKMIFYVLNKQCDLTILDRAGDRSAIWGWTNCARFFGGERAFWKKDFLEIKLPYEGGYLLEIVMNLHYIKRNKKIRNVYCDNLYTVHQYHKFGIMRGYYNYLKMSIKIVRKATVRGFISQIRTIEDDHKYFQFRKWQESSVKKYRYARKKVILKSRYYWSNLSKLIKF